MPARRRSNAKLAGVLTAALLCACETPVHPNNPGIPDEICQPRCQKLHECDPSVDQASCLNACRHHLSPRVIYEREDYVATLRACATQQTCSSNVQRAIHACSSAAHTRLEPTPRAVAFCEQRVEKDRICGDTSGDYAHCVYGHKSYTEAILAQLTDCLDNPCKNYGRCQVAVVGNDEAIDDEDRAKEFHARLVPTAPPPRESVRLDGHAVGAGTNLSVPAAKLCIDEHPEIACVETDDAGLFSLILPARRELVMLATAAGYRSRAMSFTTADSDWKSWAIGLTKESTVNARVAAFGARVDAGSTGSIFATANAPKGSQVGLEGLATTIQPQTGAGPFYFAPNSDPAPSRTTTSTWSSALFLNVAPGDVELTFAPDAVTCTTDYGGWPTKKQNTVRVRVVAGYETRVAMRCSR